MADVHSSFRSNLFKGQHVLVSVASSGIGLAIAHGFAELGAHVVGAGKLGVWLVEDGYVVGGFK